MNKKLIGTAVLFLLGACSTIHNDVESLATARLASDRDLYSLRRVGVLPIDGLLMRADDALAFQGALVEQLSRRMHAEVIALDASDVAEVPEGDAFRTGRIEPKSILALSRRFNLDGLVTATVTERRAYAPQRFAVEVDLTACDTGLPIWGASLHLDAAQERTQHALRMWFENERTTHNANESWDLYLLSPQRFAEFAAAQVGLSY